MDLVTTEKLKEIERLGELAQAGHRMKLLVMEKLIECKRAIVGLVKASNIYQIQCEAKLSLLKSHRDMEMLEYKMKLERENLKQLDAKYEFYIELPAKLQAYLIGRLSTARMKRIERETKAKVHMIRELGLAVINYNIGEQLASAHASKQIGFVLNKYQKALIIDQLAALVLRIISERLVLDPQFRFKLERPLQAIEMNVIELEQDVNELDELSCD